MKSPISYFRHCIALVGSSLLAVGSSQAAIRTWGGGNLDWTNTDPSGWNGSAPTTSATINSGTVTVTTDITTVNTPGTVNINGGMLVISTGKLVGGTWSNAKTFTIGGGATLHLSSWGYDVAGSLGALDYGRGRLVVNGGIIEVIGNSTGSGRNFTVGTGGATLRSSVNSGQTWTLNRDANSLYWDIQVNNGRTLTLDGTGNGVIENTIVNSSGTGNITKAGTGTWTLSAANTYSGTTTISAGKLQITNAAATSATGSGVVNLSGGITTTLSGTGISTGLLTVTNASRIAAGINTTGTNGNFGAAGTLSLGTTGGMTLTNANFDFDLANLTTVGGGVNDLILTGGVMSLTGTEAFTFNLLNATLDTSTAYTLISGASSYSFLSGNTSTWTTNFVNSSDYTASYSFNGNAIQVTFSAIPEPSAALLGALGALLLFRRRR